MSSTRVSSIGQRATQDSERIWPLDAAIIALAGLVLYLVFAQFSFDDPRWAYNGWTYVVAIPMAALAFSVASRFVVSRFVNKSLQIGLLSSAFVHLLLMILAINVVIFRHYFPDALTGVKQQRTPINRTIPEYVFRATNEAAPTPDWSKPVDADTTSRVVPTEKRQIPPVDHTAAKMEMPRPKDPDQRPLQKFMRKRDLPSQSLPQPADSPGRLASPTVANRQRSAIWSTSNPTAPDLKFEETSTPQVAERQVDASAQRQPSLSRESVLPAQQPTGLPIEMNDASAIMKSEADRSVLPEIEPPPVPRREPQTTKRTVLAAGASPSAASVAMRSSTADPQRTIDPIDAIPLQKSDTGGADVMMQTREDFSLAMNSNPSIRPIVPQRRRGRQTSEIPEISTANVGPPVDPRSSSPLRGRNLEPAGVPSEVDGPITSATNGQANDESISDRLTDAMANRRAESSSPVGPALDLLLDSGPVGMASRPSREVGIVPGDTIPDVAALELSPGLERRRDLGGPVTPFGTKIAAVESFSRRMKRTEAGAAPTPAGEVGPATEEAIERGLEYLAGTQNADGSWSLQGHGSEVVLRSDTAATGLCLLAFQGAGYTHRQHKYADTISRGLQFMLTHQKTNGDLYRRENQISNENVALYSHGIATLALCEAFGMTQDPELENPAQEAIRYIVETQHHRRGGWRYTPQVSADTSVTGWMMMALKSGQLSGLEVPERTYDGIDQWLDRAQGESGQADRYRYNPFAPDTPAQRHGRVPTPTMTAVGMLMRMYTGWRRDNEAMQSAADYLMEYPPQMGTPRSPQRDGYYWYYATMVMFHMGGDHWKKWNSYLKPVLLRSQINAGEMAGSWDPIRPVPDRWSPHAGRIYVTTMNLLNLEVYYRHLPIYDESAQ